MTIDQKRAIAVTVGFLLLICIFGSLTLCLGIKDIGYATLLAMYAGEGESRAPAERICRMVDACQSTYNERFYMKEDVSALATSFSSVMEGELTIESTQVMQGKEGWLFYKSVTDGDSLADYCGTNTFSDAQREAIRSTLCANRHMLALRGIRYALLIAPNKERVYSQYMPDTVWRKNVVSRTDRLVVFLRTESDLDIVYPYEELAALSKTHRLYTRTDTHWNAQGAYIGVQQLMENLYGERKQLSERRFIDEESTGGDLLGMLIRKSKINQQRLLDYYLPDVAYTITPAPADMTRRPETVLLIGDSFSYPMVEFMEEEFSKVYQTHINDYNKKMLEQYCPDIVVQECVERYSYNLAEWKLV